MVLEHQNDHLVGVLAEEVVDEPEGFDGVGRAQLAVDVAEEDLALLVGHADERQQPLGRRRLFRAQFLQQLGVRLAAQVGPHPTGARATP